VLAALAGLLVEHPSLFPLVMEFPNAVFALNANRPGHRSCLHRSL
jgi:hypothetical protein